VSLTDINKWISDEIDLFLAPQVVLGKDADSNLDRGASTVIGGNGRLCLFDRLPQSEVTTEQLLHRHFLVHQPRPY
jgi:hypothetical protein